MEVVALFPDVQIAHAVKLHERAEDSLVRQVIPQLVSQLGQLEGILAEGTEDSSKALGIDREIQVLQQLRGDGGFVGMIKVQTNWRKYEIKTEKGSQNIVNVKKIRPHCFARKTM